MTARKTSHELKWNYYIWKKSLPTIHVVVQWPLPVMCHWPQVQNPPAQGRAEHTTGPVQKDRSRHLLWSRPLAVQPVLSGVCVWLGNMYIHVFFWRFLSVVSCYIHNCVQVCCITCTHASFPPLTLLYYLGGRVVDVGRWGLDFGIFSMIKSFYRAIGNWPQRANKNHIFTQQFRMHLSWCID